MFLAIDFEQAERAGGRGRVPWRGAAVRAAAAAAGGGRLVLGRLVVAAGARGPAPARPVHHCIHPLAAGGHDKQMLGSGRNCQNTRN